MRPIRPLLAGALLAAGAAATPAGAALVCADDPAFPPDVYACLHSDVDVEGTTVFVQAGVTCQAGPVTCYYRPVTLNRTGVGESNDVWVNGFQIDPCRLLYPTFDPCG